MFFLTIGSGIWLSNSGKPYNTVIFTIHKLIALTAVVFTVILIVNLFRNVEIENYSIFGNSRRGIGHCIICFWCIIEYRKGTD